MTASPCHLRLLASCSAAALSLAAPPSAQELTPRQIHRELEVLMTLPSRHRVRVAVGRLGGGGKAVVRELLILLDDPRLLVRTQVYRVLGDLGKKARPAVPALLRRARRTEDSWERVRAAQLALKIDRDCVQAMHILGRSKNMHYRSDAADGLGEFAGRKNVDLLAVLIDDEMGKVRKVAFRALEQHGEDAEPVIPQVIKAMVGRHARKLDPEDIPGAIHSGGTALDGAGRVLANLGDKAVKALLQRHREGDAKTQLHVLNALGGMGDRRAQRRAIHVSLLAADPKVRDVAYKCLMSLEVTDADDLPVLLRASARFGAEGMRAQIVRYLRAQSPTRAVRALRHALANGDAACRRTVVDLLPDLQRTARTRHAHTELFLAALGDPEAEVRHGAAAAVARYRDPDPVLRAPLLRMLRGADLADRQAARRALRAWRRR